MKIIVDTNVFISGVFFSGLPYRILDAWRNKKFQLVISPDIFIEYQTTGEELSMEFPDVDLGPWLDLVLSDAEMIQAKPLLRQVCADPDDGKFLACAQASHTKHIISGDKALLLTSGYNGIQVLKPRQCFDTYLNT